jgi:hypothetical protein
MVRAYAVFWRQKFKRLNFCGDIEQYGFGDEGRA